MKIPKTFIPEKNLDRTLETLLLENQDSEGFGDKKAVAALLTSFDTFTKQRLAVFYSTEEIYNVGKKIADQMTHFTKDDLEGLSRRLNAKNCNDLFLGLYISALINRIINENDTVTLHLDVPLNWIGAYQEKGTTAINGDLGYFTGLFLQGGTLLVEGNTGHRTGNGMEAGKIVITGRTGEDTGDFMKGGEIITYGPIKAVSSNCRGTIYSMGKRLR